MLVGLMPLSVNAATLFLSPSSGEYDVGRNISVNVYVSSVNQSINAVSGVLTFPKDKLDVTSISKANSLISLWVQEPSFSNNAGTVNFEGIIMNPGFSGENGRILTINFRTKVAGFSVINFSSGTVLANDGNGTNILKSLGSSQLSLGGVAKVVPESTTPTLSENAPSAPLITSNTHPDPNSWYSEKNPKFSWEIPDGITGVRFFTSKTNLSMPTAVPASMVTEREYSNYADGIWYFHLQFRNKAGWGQVSHFRFQIDTKPPEPFDIKFSEGVENGNPRPAVDFTTTDTLSGVDHYRVKIGEGEFFKVMPDELTSGSYTLPLQNYGKRNILVQAFDKADNYFVATKEFTIKPLEAPVFTDYPSSMRSDEVLIVKGHTNYPNSQLVIKRQRERDDIESFVSKTGQDGSFTFTFDEKVRDGIYQLWAEVIDGRGAKSLPSDKVAIVVGKSLIIRIGTNIIIFLLIAVPLILLILTLVLIFWYAWRKYLHFRTHFHNGPCRRNSQGYDLLKDNVKKQIKLLEGVHTKRALTKEEEKILKEIKSGLEEAQKKVAEVMNDRIKK